MLAIGSNTETGGFVPLKRHGAPLQLGLLVDEGSPHEATRQLRTIACAEAVEVLLRRVAGQTREEAEGAHGGVAPQVVHALLEGTLQLGLGERLFLLCKGSSFL